MGFGLCLPQPHSSICLIPLWLANLKRPSCVPGPHVGLGRERPPPKQGGHAVPHRWQVLHASVPDPMGSLTSSFIPAGRLGKTPFPLALHRVGSVLAVKGSLRRFAPWTAPGRSERRAAYEGKGGVRAVGREGELAHDKGYYHSYLGRSRKGTFRPYQTPEPQPWGAVTRRAVAQRRSRASGLTRPSAKAIRGLISHKR